MVELGWIRWKIRLVLRRTAVRLLGWALALETNRSELTGISDIENGVEIKILP